MRAVQSGNGKVALISGLRKGGIGFSIGSKLCRSGYRVYACERDAEVAEEALAFIRDAQPDADIRCLLADVTLEGDVHRLMDTIATESGHLDSLINNAGDAGPSGQDNLRDLTISQFRRVVDNNLTSAFLLTQSAVANFFRQQQSGSVVYLSTNNGAVGQLGQLAYGTAKQALVAMIRILVAEHQGTNIRFNAISPGIVETNSVNWQERRRKSPDWSKIEASMNSLSRLGRPDDVANLVHFLVSDEATFINGCDIPIDGGMRASGPLFPGVDPADARRTYVETVRAMVAAKERSKKAA